MKRNGGNEGILTRHVTCRPHVYGVTTAAPRHVDAPIVLIIWYPLKPRSGLAKPSRARAKISDNSPEKLFRAWKPVFTSTI